MCLGGGSTTVTYCSRGISCFLKRIRLPTILLCTIMFMVFQLLVILTLLLNVKHKILLREAIPLISEMSASSLEGSHLHFKYLSNALIQRRTKSAGSE